MKLDLARAEIRPPRSEELSALYRMLAEVFPVEAWLFRAVEHGDAVLYGWRPLCMVLDGEIIGNVSRVDLTVFLAGHPASVLGLASVATPLRYRGQGIARRLLLAAIAESDAEDRLSALFTGLPSVYGSTGFQAVPQDYRLLTAERIPVETHGLRAAQWDAPDAPGLDAIARLYSDILPNYDGKLLRDAAYWRWYVFALQHAPQKRLLVCRRGDATVGYARVETEGDRILVSEFCCAPEDIETIEALLSFAQKATISCGLERMTLALPMQHFLWPVLSAMGLGTSREEPLERREVFMMRGARTAPLPPEARALQWCLADKF